MNLQIPKINKIIAKTSDPKYEYFEYEKKVYLDLL
jgi:hypothetical protein